MQSKISELLKQTSSIFLDKEEAVKLSTVCLLAGGHLLIEDVPGVGKTTLVQTLGQLLGLKTNRIQFTIDLLPGDILGGHIYDPRDHEFHFHQGPLFAELILADELNRASPRTQSALLQAMEEGQVSLDGKTWNLPKPFFVIATQNPHQNLGTFPLPESQLDRFMVSLELNFASKNTEIEIFKNKNPREKIGSLKALFTAPELIEIQNMIENIHVSDNIAEYVGLLLENSRKSDFAGEAISTRAGIALIRAAKAWAFLEDRNFLKPEDIKNVLLPVLGHRVGGTHGLRQGREWTRALEKQTPVPR
ncbi:MAG: AAA family ATPase [Pseudobdellovibrio sp.]